MIFYGCYGLPCFRRCSATLAVASAILYCEVFSRQHWLCERVFDIVGMTVRVSGALAACVGWKLGVFPYTSTAHVCWSRLPPPQKERQALLMA